MDSILTYMTSRFNKEYLESLTEALETVYNYAARMAVPIREATAPYIAAVGHNDLFYISPIILYNSCAGKMRLRCQTPKFPTTRND